MEAILLQTQPTIQLAQAPVHAAITIGEVERMQETSSGRRSQIRATTAAAVVPASRPQDHQTAPQVLQIVQDPKAAAAAAQTHLQENSN